MTDLPPGPAAPPVSPTPSVPTARPARAPGPRGTLVLLRISSGLAALAVLAQPILAGAYLQGDFDALAIHGLVGSLLILVMMLNGAVALLYWLFGRGSPHPFGVAVLIFLACGIQIGMGFARELWIHIPLGVAIVAMVLANLFWVLRRRAGESRRPRVPSDGGLG